MMKQLMLYVIIFLFGLAVTVGLGVSAFLLGERLLSRKVTPIQSPNLELTGSEPLKYKLVVEKSGGQQFDCSTELPPRLDQSAPILTVVAVTELPDPELHLVSLSGCPLTDKCPRQAETVVKQTY
jgi:hypothetical protein